MNALMTHVPTVPLAALVQFEPILSALIYSAIGVVLFAVAFFVIVTVTPFSVRKEIEEDQNTSLGIIIGAVLIGLSIIISSAIQG